MDVDSRKDLKDVIVCGSRGRRETRCGCVEWRVAHDAETIVVGGLSLSPLELGGGQFYLVDVLQPDKSFASFNDVEMTVVLKLWYSF